MLYCTLRRLYVNRVIFALEWNIFTCDNDSVIADPIERKSKDSASLSRCNLNRIIIGEKMRVYISRFKYRFFRIVWWPLITVCSIASVLSVYDQLSVISKPRRRHMRKNDSFKRRGERGIKPSLVKTGCRLNSKEIHSVRHSACRITVSVWKSFVVFRTHSCIDQVIFVHNGSS